MSNYNNYQLPPGSNPYYRQAQQQPPQQAQAVVSDNFKGRSASFDNHFPSGSTHLNDGSTCTIPSSFTSSVARSGAFVFDPYASVPPQAPPPATSFPLQQQLPAYGKPAAAPTFSSLYGSHGDTMTTAGYGSTTPSMQFAIPPTAANHVSAPNSDDVSVLSMGTAKPTTTPKTALTPAPASDLLSPDLVAEQERRWKELQRESQLRKQQGGDSLVPTRSMPLRTRSLPHGAAGNKNYPDSIATGGVAVVHPKYQKYKQQRQFKTAGGAVGGALVGGLVLGPVGLVLGAGGGAFATNKIAKCRDKRKQAKFEQDNFQKGAASSVAGKGQGAYV